MSREDNQKLLRDLYLAVTRLQNVMEKGYNRSVTAILSDKEYDSVKSATKLVESHFRRTDLLEVMEREITHEVRKSIWLRVIHGVSKVIFIGGSVLFISTILVGSLLELHEVLHVPVLAYVVMGILLLSYTAMSLTK